MEKLTKSDIISIIKKENYKFAWINTFNDLKLIELVENNVFKKDYLDNLIEAKIFNKEKELSILPYEDGHFSVVEFEGREKEFIEERQVLDKHKSPYRNKNDKLVIRNYLNYEKDGQAFIYYSKLYDVERGQSDGK